MKFKITTILCCWAVLSSAQQLNITDNFYVQTQYWNQHYDSLHQIYGDTVVLAGEKSYYKWQRQWESLVYPSGDFQQALLNISTNQSSAKTALSTINTNWEALGPTTPPLNSNIWNYNEIRGIGQIHCITFDPNNENKVFASSPSGGLFFSNDKGQSWQNGGTDFLSDPSIGISGVVVASTQPNTWLVCTGDADGNNWDHSTGIYRTTDAGANWHPVNNGIIPVPNLGTYGLGFRKMIIHPTNPNIVLGASRGGIYRTANALTPNPANGGLDAGSK